MAHAILVTSEWVDPPALVRPWPSSVIPGGRLMIG